MPCVHLQGLEGYRMGVLLMGLVAISLDSQV
jgi:hypothetical protein